MAELVLVYPKTGFDIKGASVDLPLSSLSVASVVCNEREVKIIDQRTDAAWARHLKKELEKNPTAVGVSSMTGTQIKYALEAAKIVKQNPAASPETKLLWGGIHATLLPAQTAGNEFVDVAIAGEGEAVIGKLLSAIEKRKPLNNVPGIFYRKNGRISKTALPVAVDMNTLPEIPFELVEIKNYINSRAMVKEGVERVLPFITSRGCPYRCAFCCNPVLSKQRWRSMKAEVAYRHVSAMVERFDLDGVTFHDENFFGNPKRAMELASLFAGKFSWSVQARMDALERVDLKALEKNGLGLVQPGVETGSERIMNLIHKDETIGQILNVNRLLAKTSITPVYNFMMGFPTETIPELHQTVDLALKLLDDNQNATLSGFYVFVPYPGSELYDFAVKEGAFVAPKSLDEWAAYSRMHLNTPWIEGRKAMLRNLMFTSKFVDGKRLNNILKSLHLPKSLVGRLGSRYRNKWRRHDFGNSIDVMLLHAFAKFYFGWQD